MTGVRNTKHNGRNMQPTSKNQARIAILSGRLPGARSAVPCSGQPVCRGDPSARAVEGCPNCSFTVDRLKNTSHQTPIPASVSMNAAMNIRMLVIIEGSTVLFCAVGKGTIRVTNPEKPPIKISRTEKTMIETRAQFFSRHKPIPVTMPQTAGSRYVSEAKTSRTLKKDGEPGNGFVWDTGAMIIINSMRIPMANVNIDPSSDKITITVTPTERFMAAAPRFTQAILVTP